ncbi:hypothetical protein NE321_01645 [Salmonella enterica subsp. indica serovar 11:b:e,n,x]
MVRQRASAGGCRNVVQTAHDLRRVSLLTDTPRTRFRLRRKRVFIDRSAFIDLVCSLSLFHKNRLIIILIFVAVRRPQPIWWVITSSICSITAGRYGKKCVICIPTWC